MLSRLQEQIARIIASLDEAEGFALAGGAAMISRGDVERSTRDLDFFGLSAEDVARLAPAVERRLREAGLAVRTLRSSPGFVRLIVEGEDEKTEVDLAADARLFPAERGDLAPTLRGEELAVDKILAVFGRAEARDFVDLLAVADRYGLDRLFDLATEKDQGFEPDVFAEMLARFGRLRRDEFPIDDAGYQKLKAAVAGWQQKTVESERRRKQQLEHDADIGFEL